ncbi:hypothetical protein MTsN2n4_22920 [Pseudoalteromonas sp. MTN2-4]
MAYQKTDYARDLSVAGEWFATNEWFVTGSVGDIGHVSYNNSVGFGYLLDNKIKISARYDNWRHTSNRTMVKAEYNHQINDTDYLGVTLNVESDLDTWSLASRYFKHVYGDSFVSLDIYHEDDECYDYTSVVGNYYMNRNLSFGLGSYDSDLGIQAKYFFNDNFHLVGSIIDFDEGEVYQLSFTAQY